MSKPSAEVHAGRLSVPLQALTFSVAVVLKDLDPLFDENISTLKNDSSKWAEQSISRGLPTSPPAIVNSLIHSSRGYRKKATPCLAESCLHPNAAQYSIVFAVCKSNIKANKM